MVVRIGVIGVGSMGSLHARVIATNDRTELAWVADPSASAGEPVARRLGSRWLPEPDLSVVDAVVVAAPTQYHHQIAIELIRARIPLLLEKPAAETLGLATELVQAADSTDAILMCGFLERFNPAVRTACEIARSPIRVTTARHSPYTARIRTGVASDLIIHDADMVLRLLRDYPASITGRYAYFAAESDHGSEDVAEALALFGGGQIATLSASRVGQRKVRSLVISEADREIEVDLLRQMITVYRHVEGARYDEEAGYHQQTIIDIPVVRHTGEPLQLQLQHFLALLDGSCDVAAERAGILAPHRFVDDLANAANSD